MKPEDENIETLSRAIMREAQADAEQIKTDAQTKADAIRQRAQEQAEAERQTILARANQEAERLRSQVMATTQLKARTQQLEHREKLLDQVFKAARQKLLSVKQRSDYDQIATQLLQEAVKELNATQAKVRADAVTQDILKKDRLDKVSKSANAQLELGDPLEQGTGVTVETADGHLYFDNTLESRLSRMQSALRSSVYQVLMGEKL